MFIVYLNTDICLRVLLVETLTKVCKIVHLQIVEFPHDSPMAYLHSETASKRMNWFLLWIEYTKYSRVNVEMSCKAEEN